MRRWFHPNLSNVDAECLLLKRGQDGSFLVRPSQSCAGSYSLSVRRGNEVTHVRIRKTGGFFDLHGGERFATLTELVQQYTGNKLRENNGKVYELKYPLESSEPTTERWYHGAISGETAERLLRERGVFGSFLVRKSKSKIRDFVLTVRTKDEHGQADIVAQVIIRYHNNKYDVGRGGEQFDTLSELVEHYKEKSIVEEDGAVVVLKHPFNTTSFTALDIDARVNELSKQSPSTSGKDGFWEEFEHIQHQECKVLFNRKIGQEDRNILKNRYKNILPYDYTRVILKKPLIFRNANQINHNHHYPYPPTQQQQQHHHQHQHQHQQQNLLNESNNNTSNTTTTAINTSDSDYINANYIKLVDDDTTISPRTKPVANSKIYIATQGPLPNTVHDFWLMVWQEKSDCIVMLTKDVEREKNKCHPYWPTLEQPSKQFGPIEVSILSEVPRNQSNADEDEYTIREFELRCLGGEINDYRAARRVVQYQYSAWPDQQIPSDPGSILGFLQDINQRQIHGPLIVHCSAGIGRTGALIVIDMIIDQLISHGITYEIDIQRIVKVTRAQRSGLVQTEAQYKFIFLAIQRYIASMMH